MARCGFAATAIQNSVRELNLLDDLLAGRPPQKNVAFGFGTIESGYTGSSFEGLWVSGVLDAFQHGAPGSFGADADHIQVKRGSGGLASARRLVEASRYYSFFTLDVSDVLDYAALAETSVAAAEADLDAVLPSSAARKALLAYHRGSIWSDRGYRPDGAVLGRLAGKYWDALDALANLGGAIEQLKAGVPTDLELSIDEHPAEIASFDCLTSETELIFVLLEAQRRGIRLTHVAPNFGVEKGTDYRCPDGLAGLAARSQSLSRISEEFGVIVDYHSGDDLSAETRRVIGRATGGRNHFKVSPMLQLIFAGVLADFHPALFWRWWHDARAYAEREAANGSTFAAACLRRDRAAGHDTASMAGEVFHHFSFAFVGRRDVTGQFQVRETFYDLAPEFYAAYQDRLVDYLCGLAGDLF